MPTDADFLLLPVELAGRRVNFIIDTGATVSVLDQSLARVLPPLKPSSKSYSKGVPSLFEMPDAVLVGSKLSIIGDAVVVDLSLTRKASGHDIQGIIGVDFLQNYVIRIDSPDEYDIVLKNGQRVISLKSGCSR